MSLLVAGREIRFKIRKKKKTSPYLRICCLHFPRSLNSILSQRLIIPAAPDNTVVHCHLYNICYTFKWDDLKLKCISKPPLLFWSYGSCRITVAAENKTGFKMHFNIEHTYISLRLNGII